MSGNPVYVSTMSSNSTFSRPISGNPYAQFPLGDTALPSDYTKPDILIENFQAQLKDNNSALYNTALKDFLLVSDTALPSDYVYPDIIIDYPIPNDNTLQDNNNIINDSYSRNESEYMTYEEIPINKFDTIYSNNRTELNRSVNKTEPTIDKIAKLMNYSVTIVVNKRYEFIYNLNMFEIWLVESLSNDLGIDKRAVILIDIFPMSPLNQTWIALQV